MFRGRFEMNATCPVCGHRFEREPGFFQGAMYVSYGIGIVYIGVLAILANTFLVAHIGVVPAAGCIVAIHLACVPAVFRYSRVILGAPERRHAQTLMSPAHGAVELLSGRRRRTIKRTSSSRNPSVTAPQCPA